MDPITAFIIQALIGAAISGIASLAQQAFAPKPKAVKQLPGMRGQYTTGGTVPQTIVLGTYGVAGQLEYSNTWGNDGETPNAYLVDVISLSDYQITEVSALWIDSKSVSLPGTGLATPGYPIPEFDAGGKHYAYYRFRDGSQSTVLTYLTDKFGADAKRPWEDDMVGEGIAYAVQTARINEGFYTDFPRYMYEMQGAPVFDPRESTAAGGSGSQVWGTFSTYEFSDNPIVLALNILMGIRDPDGNHIWGGTATLAQFDYANLEAAMDRCDDAIPKKAGGTEKRYRAGIEISLDERPADVLRDLMVAANARITFTKGKYYFLVDVPSVAAGSFTDGDLLIEEPIDFTWFPNQDDTINGIAATFLAPQRAWEERPTKPYYRSDLEAIDGKPNRQKLQLRCVFSGSQAQRIIKAVVEEGRRFKKHVVCLPDNYRAYRPLQVLAWTSDEFQYSSKLFLILSRTEDEWGRIWFALQEIDPDDFDWDAETDETELTYASTEEAAVPTQAVAGWFVEKYTDGVKPGIHLQWVGSLEDIGWTQVLIRLSGEVLGFFDREFPYDEEHDTQDIYILGDPLRPVTAYEVSARFVPKDRGSRPTTWTSWFAVTTDDVPGFEIPDNSITNEMLMKQWRDAIQWIVDDGPGTIVERMERGARKLAGKVADNIMTADRDIRQVSQTAGDAASAVRDELLAITNPEGTSALAQAIRAAVASNAKGLAEGLFTVQAYTGDPETIPPGFPVVDVPNYVAVRLALVGRTTDTSNYEDAGIYIDIMPVTGGGFRSAISMKADSINFIQDDAASQDPAFVYENGELTLAVARIREIIGGIYRNSSGSSVINLNTGALRLATGS